MRLFVAWVLVSAGVMRDSWGMDHLDHGYGPGLGYVEEENYSNKVSHHHVETSPGPSYPGGSPLMMGLGGLGPSGHGGPSLGRVVSSNSFSSVNHETEASIGPGVHPALQHIFHHGDLHPAISHQNVHTGTTHSVHVGISPGFGHPPVSVPLSPPPVTTVVQDHHISSPGGGVTRVVQTHTVIHHPVGVGPLGGVTSLGNIRRSLYSTTTHLTPLSSPYGGYYGGILSYPMMSMGANKVHVTSSIMDAFKGYFGGYFPGSIGYGQSYRFFH